MPYPLFLAIFLSLAALGHGDSSCNTCQLPVYDGFSHDADNDVKKLVFANEGRAGFVTPIFGSRKDSQGCMFLHAQCFGEFGDGPGNTLPPPRGDIIDVVIPPIVPNKELEPSRIRRQVPEDHLYNYFIWTAHGRNHSLRSFWDHQRGMIQQTTFQCNDKAQWTYKHSNGTITHVTGLYCFWVARDLAEQIFG